MSYSLQGRPLPQSVLADLLQANGFLIEGFSISSREGEAMRVEMNLVVSNQDLAHKALFESALSMQVQNEAKSAKRNPVILKEFLDGPGPSV